MAVQREAGVTKSNKPKAIRKAANVTTAKAIWIDCDIKVGDPKHYGTMDEAWDAFTRFRKELRLPFPRRRWTAAVASISTGYRTRP